MAYNTKSIVTDKDGKPISQYYNPDTDSYEPVEGSHGANKVMVGNNDLSLIVDKLSQLTGTVIDEETRKTNEDTRQSNELQRIDNENTRKINEEIRIQNENTRVQNENIRQTNEDTRIVNENARVLAEQERATTFAGYENRVTNVENDLAQHKLDYASQRQQDQLKLAKVEKDINDYKQVMSQVNINQEAKQSISGYGILSLPKNAANGQVSTTVAGRTYTNIFGDDGDFEEFVSGTPKGWNIRLVTVEQVESFDGGRALKTRGRESVSEVTKVLNVQPNKKHLFSVWARRTDDAPQGSTSIIVHDGPDETYPTLILKTVPKNTAWELFVSTFTPTTSTCAVRIKISGGEGTREIQTDKFCAIAIENEDYDLSDADLLKKYPYVNGTKSTVGAMRLKSVSADETETSTAYVVAKDEEGNIIELHSLPNGVADKIYQGTNGKWYLEKNIGISKDFSECTWAKLQEGHTDNFYAVQCSFTEMNVDLSGKHLSEVSHKILNYTGNGGMGNEFLPTDDYFYRNNILSVLQIKVPKSAYSGEWTLEETQEWFRQNDVKLIYQLAEPVEIPIEVSGNIVSYPSGTIYIEPFVADAGIYTDKMEVLHSDLPIKTLEKIYKVDFSTGLETELDITAAVIAEDKLSFTHPDLVDGDIVFFTYEYDRESTEGETEIEYYDSRYVIKDSVTGKFYKWHIAVADGVPSIELTEV